MCASWISRFFASPPAPRTGSNLLSESALLARLDQDLAVRRFRGQGALARAAAFVLDGRRASVELSAGECSAQAGAQALQPGKPLSLVIDLVPGLEPGAVGDGLARAISRLRSLDIPVLAVSAAEELLPLSLLARRLSEELLRPVALVRDLSPDGKGFFGLESSLTRKTDWQTLLDWVGQPTDELDCRLPSQRVLFGTRRPRVPRLVDELKPRGVAVLPEHRLAVQAGLQRMELEPGGREELIRALELGLADLAGWSFLQEPQALRGTVLVARGVLAGRCRTLLAQGAAKELSLLCLRRLHPLPAACAPAALPQPLAVLEDDDAFQALPPALAGMARLQITCASGGSDLEAGDLLAISRALAEGREGQLHLGLHPGSLHPASPREQLRSESLKDAWPALDRTRLNPASATEPTGRRLALCLLAGSAGSFGTLVPRLLETLQLLGGTVSARRLAAPGGDRGLVRWRVDWAESSKALLPADERPANLVALLDERAARELPHRLLAPAVPLVFRLSPGSRRNEPAEWRVSPAAADHNGPLRVLDLEGDSPEELAGGLLATVLEVLGQPVEGALKQALRDSTLLQRGANGLKTLDPALLPEQRPRTLPLQAHGPAMARLEHALPPLDDPMLPSLVDSQADNPVDPLSLSGLLPARSGRLRREQRRPDLPRLSPDLCTSCGDCFSLCPEGALPLRLLEPADLLESLLAAARAEGSPLARLEGRKRALASRLGQALAASGSHHDARAALGASLDGLLAEEPDDGLRAEVRHAQALLGHLPLVHWARKPGVLLAIGVDADACKGCSLCARACEAGALEMAPWQTVWDTAGREWAAFQQLPSTRRELLPGAEACRSHPEDLLLDSEATEAFGPGDESPAGNTARSVLRVWAGMAQGLLSHRLAGRDHRLADLRDQLRARLQHELSPELGDPAALKALVRTRTGELDLAGMLAEGGITSRTLDKERLARLAGLLEDLDAWITEHEAGGAGRNARLALCLPGRGLDLCWPWNPSSLPTVILDPGALADQALGLAEALAEEHAQRVRLLRLAALSLSGRYSAAVHENEFRHFDAGMLGGDDWQDCPPLLLAVDASVLGGGSLQAWRTLLGGAVPVKLLVVCDAGDSDALALAGLATRPLPCFSGSHADLVHLREGLAELLDCPGPGVATVYCSRRPLEARAGEDTASALEMARLAFEHGLWPHYRYQPAWGAGPHESLVLHPDQPAARQPLELRAAVSGLELDSPVTLAHLRALERAWPGDFHVYDAVHGEGGREPLPLAEYMDLDGTERPGSLPLIQAGEGGAPRTLVPCQRLVRDSEALGRRWGELLDLARRDLRPVDADALREEGRKACEATLLATLGQSLLDLANTPDNGGGER
jgi:ferredoxin